MTSWPTVAEFLSACQGIFISYEGSFSKLLPGFVYHTSIFKEISHLYSEQLDTT